MVQPIAKDNGETEHGSWERGGTGRRKVHMQHNESNTPAGRVYTAELIQFVDRDNINMQKNILDR